MNRWNAHRSVGQAAPEASLETTLLELVWVLTEVTQDDAEVVATLRHLVRTGRLRLTGGFRSRALAS